MRVSFEEACALSKTMVTAEKLSVDYKACMKEYTAALAELGWTTTELCEEARIRMHARIAEMRAQHA